MGKVTHNLKKKSTSVKSECKILTFTLFYIFFNSQAAYQYEGLCLQLHLHKVKSKVHPCTGTEALYRPYAPLGGVEI